MANLPRLAYVDIEDDADEFEANMARDEDGDVLVTLTANNSIAVAVLGELLDRADIEWDADYTDPGAFATIVFGFRNATLSEATGMVNNIFGTRYRGLNATYYFEVESGASEPATLGAVLSAEPGVLRVAFGLTEGDDRSTPRLWSRFNSQIREYNGDWTDTELELDRVRVTLSSTARTDLEAALLRLVSLFSFSPVVETARPRPDTLGQQRLGRELRNPE